MRWVRPERFDLLSQRSVDVGDSTSVERWGHLIAITQDTETGGEDFQLADEPWVSANYQALITQNGGNFDGTGEIHAQLHFSVLRHLS